MKTPIWEVSFWICLVAIVYHYAGYPLLLFILSVLSQAKSDFLYLIGRGNRRSPRETGSASRVALLISAYNEEAVIQAKVKNTLEIDYPAEHLEVLVGLDPLTATTAKGLVTLDPSRLNSFQFRAV